MLGVILLVAAYPASQYRLLRAGKWREAVPTWTIVYCWPLDFETWDTVGAEPMIDELVLNRLADPTKHEWAARWFASRYASAIDSMPVDPDVDAPRGREVFDCSEHWEELGRDAYIDRTWGVCGYSPPLLQDLPDPPVDLPRASQDCMQELSDLVTDMVQIDDWHENGGDRGVIQRFGPVMVIDAPSRVAKDASNLLQSMLAYARRMRTSERVVPEASIRQGNYSVCIYDLRPLLRHAPTKLDTTAAASQICDVVAREVEPDSWQSHGGEEGHMFYCRGTGLVVIRHHPEVQSRVATFLASIESKRWWE